MLGIEELHVLLEKEYNLQAEKINPVAQDAYRIKTEQGYFQLSRIMMKPKSLVFAYSVCQQLQERGLTQLPTFRVTQSGKPYFEAEGRYWILTQWVTGRKPELHQLKDVEEVTRALARLHCDLHGITSLEGGKGKKEWKKWGELVQRGKGIYEAYRKSLEEKASLTDFDQMVVERGREIDERLARVTQLVFSKSCQRLIKDEGEARAITYHTVKEKELLLGMDGQVYFTQPMRMCYDLRVKDLGKWLKRLIKKGAILEEMVPKVLSWYQAERPLSRGEKEWLLAYLLYPTKLLKMIERYFLKKKNWPEVGYVRKLRKAFQVADRELLAYQEVLIFFDGLEEE